MKKKVVVAGHICLDITPVFAGKSAERLTDILAPGKLVQVKEADIHTGGAVANTGLAMKLLGADVTLAGKVGQDEMGQMVLNILKKYGAENGMVVSEGESTSYSVVLAVPGIDRIFLHNPGANDSFLTENISKDTLQDAVLFHFGYPSLMKSMYENGGEELVKLMKTVKESGSSTSLDMAAVDADSEAGRADWNEILRKVLPYVDFFLPSVEELCYMLDKERFMNWQKQAEGRDITEFLEVERDIRPLADKCMEYGTGTVIIKCGAKGIYYRSASKEQLESVEKTIGISVEEWTDLEGFEKSYVPERILSGTGAGDTCIAAFLTAMLNGFSLKECVQLAAAQGASCVASYDALSGLKSLEELKLKIKSGWKKIN